MKSDEEILLFGLFSLSTHRDHHIIDAPTYFHYEAEIAAISIFFFRSTVVHSRENRFISYLMAIFLACLAYSKKPYNIILAAETFSYAASWLLLYKPKWLQNKNMMFKLIALVASAGLSWFLSHVVLDSMSLPDVPAKETNDGIIINLINSWFPADELRAAYNIMLAFAHPRVLQSQLAHLFFVTFHIQVGMGFLGIGFLLEEQSRRNMLIRLDVEPSTKSDVVKSEESKTENGSPDGKVDTAKMARARRYQKGAGPFILFIALPYMFQIIVYGNINRFAFTCLEQDLHRTVRLNDLFDNDSNLAAMAQADNAVSPETFANSMTSVVDKAYDIINRKLFSLPKVLLLPGVMTRQPMLMVQVFPFIFLSDWIKASLVSYMTSSIESLRKETMEIRAVRTKVESFDLKNAELLQRSGPGASAFTQSRWEELTVRIQKRDNVADLISRSKAFFAFMQRNFVFTVLIDCALASLMAVGKIVSAEIFVFSRAIEDAVDMVLIRSRSEAELAQMSTDTDKLKELADLWSKHSHEKTLLPCSLPTASEEKKLILRNVHYTRGTASVRADHVELGPGVYALTGSNGSGKSTLFRVLMSCRSNDQPIELPKSINLLTPMEPLLEEDDVMREISCTEADHDTDVNATITDSTGEPECEYVINAATGEVSEDTKTCRHLSETRLNSEIHPHPRLSITMPSSHVAEISQTFYWPLYAKPIEWIFHKSFTAVEKDTLEEKTRLVAEHLHSLDFFQPVTPEDLKDGQEPSQEAITEATIRHIQNELQEEKEDWFSDLSGGQKSKVELVRKVFLQQSCPDLLLIDETMAPLDPSSKAHVMAKLKDFCRSSVVLVIYHTDVGREVGEAGNSVECVPSNNFFDYNIHLDKGIIQIKSTC
ncbi:hypothetical protein FisN_12Hh320 [Fistulifera solaris]|uniref:Uncharacterized protein n=1 Tax=Fistulifera solaris TaxID=1519565 RepID=A0A1Z5KC80_FISSO|nr:hypothetical protein FisN_12Hh320 [Fistulifera solaris]|eukprot:GAX23742.1 hypothetical protein FisN_12Hh320 [Fistulifera solaris]